MSVADWQIFQRKTLVYVRARAERYAKLELLIVNWTFPTIHYIKNEREEPNFA